jgi:hypothetical protein
MKDLKNKLLLFFNLFILISSNSFYDYKKDPISTFSYEMMEYYSLLTSFGYCTSDLIESNTCCKNEVIEDGWTVIDYGNISVNGTKMFDYHYVILRNDLYKNMHFLFQELQQFIKLLEFFQKLIQFYLKIIQII